MGLASLYPGDVGIGDDPRVVFVEDFERSLWRIRRTWDEEKHRRGMSLSSDVPAASPGGRSLMMHKRPRDGTTGVSLFKSLVPRGRNGYETLFLRVYLKIDAESDPIRHLGTGLGGHDPPRRGPSVRAGQRPAGDRNFWTEVEPTNDSWQWDFYTYWWQMRSFENEDGSGRVTWGNTFLRDTREGSWRPIGPETERGEWVSVELMVRLNDVGQPNGEQAFWIDGELARHRGQVVSHVGPGFPDGSWIRDRWMPYPDGQPFEGLQWRNSPELLLNYVWLYIYTEEDPYEIRVWFDHVVVATSYIGPLRPASGGGGGDPE